MVLQSMRDTKFGQDGYLSKLQEPLDSCLVEISEKRTQQVEEAEGSKGQDRSTTAEEFNIPAGQGDWRGGHGDFRHQGSMGGVHTDFQTSWSKEDRGVYEARGSADTSSCQRSSGFHTGWGIGRQRSKIADTFERFSWHGHSSDPGNGATIQDSLGKAESHGGGSHAFSWASQPFQEGQESDQQCGQKDYCTGSGMDSLCSQSDDEVAAPSWLVPNVPAEHVGAVQREETGISTPEDPVVRCLTQTGRIDRSRGTSGGGTGCGTTYAGFAGQYAGGRGPGRNFGCRRYGCRNRGDGGWQAEEDSQAGTIQEIAITEQGSPAHPQEEVEDLQKPSGRDEDLNCILYAKYSWTGGAMSGERAQNLCCAEPGTKCVHFHGEIEVIVWDENRTIGIVLQETHVQRKLRALWHLHGQVCSGQEVHDALSESSQTTSSDHVGDDRSDVRGKTRSSSDASARNAKVQEMKLYEELSTLYDQCQGFGQKYIDAWYLDYDRFPICIRPRKLTFVRDMSFDSFRHECKQMWMDIAVQGEMDFQLVKPKPPGPHSTIAHVILTQGAAEGRRVGVLHLDALPIFQRNRAIVFKRDGTVRDIFQSAQLSRACSGRDSVCHVEFWTGGIQLTASDDMHIDPDHATLLNGAVRVIEDEDSDEDSDGSNDASDVTGSTHATSVSAHTPIFEFDSDDEVSWMSHQRSMSSLANQHDQQLYMWEQEDDIMMLQDDQTEVDELDGNGVTLYFEQSQQNLMFHWADLISHQHPGFDRPWIAVTFGVGVSSLGRRDVAFFPEELDTLDRKILTLWEDHANRGDLHLYVVNPQPQDIHDEPGLVFLVAVDYGEHGDFNNDDDRRILVADHSREREQQHPNYYGANIYSPATPGMIMNQLSFHDCFPNGIRECSVTLEGETLRSSEMHEIRNGALCRAYRGEYPEHITRASQHMTGAEDFFRTARTIAEFSDENEIFTIGCLGISPNNNPLHRRDLYVTYEDLVRNDWIQEAKQLWPFGHDRATITFVAAEDTILHNGLVVPTLSILVSYRNDAASVPVVISQEIFSVHEMKTINEVWAIEIETELDGHALEKRLKRKPFWHNDQCRTHLYYLGRPIGEHREPWQAGDVISTRINVNAAQYMLTLLVETHLEDHHGSDEIEELEGVSLLQKAGTKLTTQDEFQEICDALMQDVKAIIEDDELENNEWQPTREHCIDHQVETLNEAVHLLHAEGWQGLNQDFEVVTDMHPMAQLAMRETPPCTGERNVFHVFTDGTAKAGTAAWSFVVLAECQVHSRTIYYRIGYAGDLLQEDIGPFEPTALDAEATAIIGAAEYLLSRQFEDCSQIALHLHFDCTSAGFGSTGDQKIPVQQTEYSCRQKAARVLVSLLQRKRGVHSHHIHSHEGHPWNECADSIARWLREGGKCPQRPVLRSRALLSHPLCDWAWMQISPSGEIPALEDVLRQVVVEPINSEPDSSFVRNKGQIIETERVVTLKLATVNVGTLDYNNGDKETPTSHKVKELIKQFDEAGIDIIALQETRVKHDQLWKEGPYIRFLSAACKGQGGVEIWINEYTLGPKIGRALSEQDFTVWHNDGRILGMHFNLDESGVDVICCYAPQSGRSTDEISSWWHYLHTILEERPWKAPIWLLGDLNCRVGSICSDHIGDLCPDMQDLGGEHFHRICEKWSLHVPSTFGEFHEGDTDTYVSPQGYTSRIDFIAVDTLFLAGVKRSAVDHDIDALNGDADHKVVILELQCKHVQQKRVGHKRGPRYDRWEAKKNAELIQQIGASLPQIAWTKDVTEHWDIFRDHAQQALSRTFPCKKRKRRPLYFSSQAWDLVCMRKDVRLQFRMLQKKRNTIFLRACFQTWKGEIGRNDEQLDYELHQIELQMAVTLEQRQMLDQKFQIVKAVDWRTWARQQIEQQVEKSKGVRGSEIFRVLKPKAAIARASTGSPSQVSKMPPGFGENHSMMWHLLGSLSLETLRMLKSPPLKIFGRRTARGLVT